MFSDKHITAYQSIKAPDELRQKITVCKNNKKVLSKNVIKIASFAACLIIAIGVVSLYNFSNNVTKITVDGMSPYNKDVVLQGTNSVSLASAREIEIITVPINIDTKKSTIISVSCGTIVVNDESSDELLMTDKQHTVSNNTDLLWQVPENELTQNNTMTVETENTTHVISLTYDKATDTRTVSCFKK